MYLTEKRTSLIEQIQRGLLVFVLSVTCGYIVFYTYYITHINRGFGGKSDIIGYSAFHNYNSNSVLYGYVLGLLAAVGTSVIVIRYLELQRLEAFLRRSTSLFWASPIIAFALVLRSRGTWYDWTIIALTMLAVFKAVALLIDNRLKARGKPAVAEFALSIAIAATIPVLLFYVSENTGWRTAADGITHVRWFPIPLLIVAELLIGAYGIQCLRSHDAKAFEKNLVRLVLVPALIYCLTATLASEPGPGLDDFHGGEKLAPLSLALRGGLPWRDFLFIHGIWEDFLELYIPARLWELSPRAGIAGTPLLFAPIYWILFYLFFLTVFDFSLLPALTALLISISLFVPDLRGFGGQFFAFRFFLYPLILICFHKGFRSKQTVLWVLFIGVCGIQVLLAPEFALLALCFGFLVVVRDLLTRPSQQSWAKQFHPTLVCGTSTAFFIAMAAGVLWVWGFLDGFLMMTVQLARGHLQTGAIPIQPIDHLIWVSGIPLLYVVASVVLFGQLVLHYRRQVPPVLWVIWAIALCTVAYYPKYIGRPDQHLVQVFIVAEPGIALLLVFLFEEAKQSFHIRYGRWVTTAASLFLLGLVFVFKVPGDPFQDRPWFAYVLERADSFRSRFRTTNGNTEFATLMPTATTATRVEALRQFFNAHLGPTDPVFDFSDSPTTFFAILQLKPASRFIHVSLAIQEELQREVVKDLERTRPPYIVYRSDGGLNGWDEIPNEVRHYIIARYINMHYVYYRTIQGAVIFRRADTFSEWHDDGGSGNLSLCQLGYTPNFFYPRTPPQDREDALPAKATTTTYLQLNGWAALPKDNAPPDLVVSYNGTILDRFQPTSIRSDVDKALGRELGRTGFSNRIALPSPAVSAKDIEIRGGSVETGKLFHFGEGPLNGVIDSSIAMEAVPLLEPRGQRPSYLALQFEDSTTGDPQEFSVTSSQFKDSEIRFTKIGPNGELMLPLGGCYAWGTISKSTPQVVSSKPFTLKSASYYYESVENSQRNWSDSTQDGKVH